MNGLVLDAMISGLTAGIGGAVYYVQKSGLPYIDRNGLAYFPLAGMFCSLHRFSLRHALSLWHYYVGLLAALCGCWVFFDY